MSVPEEHRGEEQKCPEQAQGSAVEHRVNSGRSSLSYPTGGPYHSLSPAGTLSGGRVSQK